MIRLWERSGIAGWWNGVEGEVGESVLRDRVSSFFAELGVVFLLPVLVWSPKVFLGELVYFRLDHGIVFGVLLWVLFRGRFREDGIVRGLAIFLILALFSTLIANGIGDYGEGVLYWFQLLYLGCIFVVGRSVRIERPDLIVYGWSLSVISIAAYGIVEWLYPIEVLVEGRYRTYERLFFDGQANHIAGFLVLGVLVGVVLVREERWRVLGFVSVVMGVLALLTTGSREGVVALGAGIAVLVVVGYPRLLVPMVGVFFLGLVLSPDWFWYELSAPGSSMDDRVFMWREALGSFWSHPFFGEGLAARHRSFYDSQYVFLLSELGLIGFGLFLVWIISLARGLWIGTRGAGLGGALCVAGLASVVAVSVQGLAAVCLLITSVAGPLYWLAGVSLAMREVSNE